MASSMQRKAAHDWKEKEQRRLHAVELAEKDAQLRRLDMTCRVTVVVAIVVVIAVAIGCAV